MKRPARKEKPFPVAGVVVAALCAAVLGIAWIVIKPSKRARTAARRRPRRRRGGEAIGTTVGPDGTTLVMVESPVAAPGLAPATPRPAPQPRRAGTAAPRPVNLSPVMSSKRGADWKLAARCPQCGQEVTNWLAQTCSCGQRLTWPQELSCPFCNGGGTCPLCKGEETVCKYCKGRSRRAMMGIVLEKCGYCDGSGKCSGCKGTGKCPKCEGAGKIQPSKMSR